MRKEVRVRQIVDYLEEIAADYEIYGDLDEEIEGFSSLSSYKKNTITWLKKDGMKIPPEVSVCVVQQGVEAEAKVKIVCSNSKNVFFSILEKFWGDNDNKSNYTGENSIIMKNVQLGEDVLIGNNCVIEENVDIGKGTKIYHNVVIRKGTIIGENCTIKSGTVIGEEGYGYSQHENGIVHVPHFGHVVLEDDVEIGSNCSIDRGTIENTVIGKGSKIDNLCHIAGRHKGFGSCPYNVLWKYPDFAVSIPGH